MNGGAPLVKPLLLYLLLLNLLAGERADDCPRDCLCSQHPLMELKCENTDLLEIPSNWPRHFQRVVLRNCSLNTVEKNAFRKFKELEEIHIDSCPNLDVIDKYAFKGLPKLRLISISGNGRLRELYKASFSGIGNQHSMRIHIKGNALERIRAFTFKNAHNLRELAVEDRCFEVEGAAFSALSKVDFLSLRGVCAIAERAFQNTSRVHNLSLVDSSLDLKRHTFAGLEHVNQLQIRENRIGKVEVESFAGLFTVGSAHLQSNQIGQLQPRAFANAENLGSLVISYNTIREPLQNADCLMNGAQKFLFTENSLHCSCAMRWIQFHQDQILLAENYCGREEAFKALTYFKPIGCPPPSTTTTPASVKARHNPVTTTTSMPIEEDDDSSLNSSNRPPLPSLFLLLVCIYSTNRLLKSISMRSLLSKLGTE